MRSGKGTSSWEGKTIKTYIFRNSDDEYYLSKPTPADMQGRYFVDPEAGGFSGNRSTLLFDELSDAAAIAVTIMGGWRDAEIRYRVMFRTWAST